MECKNVSCFQACGCRQKRLDDEAKRPNFERGELAWCFVGYAVPGTETRSRVIIGSLRGSSWRVFFFARTTTASS